MQGGPVGQYDYSFQQEQHLFAAAGYVVLSVNPRGSSGRGQAFCQALFADWGGPALKDVLTAVDYAVGQGWSDPERLCVGGWSCKRRRPNDRLRAFRVSDQGVPPLADGGMLTNHIIARRTIVPASGFHSSKECQQQSCEQAITAKEAKKPASMIKKLNAFKG